MRLLMFEHCSLCFRVRMTAALKDIALDEQVVLDDDDEAMTALIGQRQIPILVLDDGTPMLESMDMVRLLDGIGTPLLIGSEHREIAEWADRFAALTPPLTMPRYPLFGLREFATVAARDHFIVRKRESLGDFVELRARTRELLAAVEPELEALDALVDAPYAINGLLSLDDVRVLPLLRSIAVVSGLEFPPRVREYFETMMQRIGHAPLPIA